MEMTNNKMTTLEQTKLIFLRKPSNFNYSCVLELDDKLQVIVLISRLCETSTHTNDLFYINHNYKKQRDKVKSSQKLREKEILGSIL